MNARDELLELKPDVGFTEARWGAVVDVILAMHAHELAEKIRQEIQLMKEQGVLELDKDWAASSAADFIDPSVPDGY